MAAPRKSLTVDVPFIIESFPAPPTHIPPSPSPATKYPPLQLPPPTRPPSQPLPPVPGPSPITDHESLVLLSTRHGSKYNVDRISIISSRGSRDSFYSARSVVLASPMPKEDNSGHSSPISLEVTEEHYDDDGSSAYEGIVVDDVLTSSPPPKIRDLVGPPPSPPMDEQELTINIPALISSSSSSSSVNPDPNDSISSISMDDLPDPDDDEDDVNILPSTAEVEAATHALQVHLEMRTARSRSIGHKKMLLSRQPSQEPSSSSANNEDQQGRAPSPDISTIIDATPRARIRPKRSASDASNLMSAMSQPSFRQRWSAASEGRSRRGRDTWDVDGFLEDYAEPDDMGGSDSDSSLDLQTPYSQILLKDGVLSPNSKSLPEAANSRPQSIASVMTNVTKSGLLKDTRDTPQRRTRHRDGKTLRGGIGLTTGLGWSDSEDEDAPSELTRRISTLRLMSDSRESLSRSSSRAVSLAGGRSLRSTRSFSASTSSVNHYPINSSMSRSSSQSSLRPFPSSMSRDTLLETEEEWEESGERQHIKSLPPTSWKRSKARQVSDTVNRDGGVYKDSPRSAASSSSSLQLSSSPLPPSPLLPHSASAGADFDEDMSLTTTVSLKRDKTLPPLPPMEQGTPGPIRELRKQASSSRLVAPRSRASSLAKSIPTPVDISMTTTSVTTTGITGPRSSTGSIHAPRTSLPRTLKLPLSRSLTQRSPGSSGDRPAVPVPGILSTTPASSSIPSPTSTFASPTTLSRPSSLSRSTGQSSGLRRPSMPTPVFTPSRSSSNASTAAKPRLSAPAGDQSPSMYASTPSRGPGSGAPSGIGRPRIGTGMVYRKSGGSSSSAGYPKPVIGKAF